jgi:F-type H+-transporting ATPase subunit a
MIPIEILSMFIKPFALTIRLFANMSAGHIVILSLLGLLFYFRTIFISPAIVGFSVFIYLLELLVAFIQAYVFTMLTAIFVSLAIGEHGAGEH